FGLRPPHWQLSALVNGVGAVATGVVMVVIAISKWAAGEKIHMLGLAIPTGAYMVVLLVPSLVYFFFLIHNHYRIVRHQLTLEGCPRPKPKRNTVLVLTNALHRGTLPAIPFAPSIPAHLPPIYLD